MLALGDQTLMDRIGQHRDAVPADLVAEVLAGDANGTRKGRTQDIHIQLVPLLRGKRRASGGHFSRERMLPFLIDSKSYLNEFMKKYEHCTSRQALSYSED